MKKVILNFNYTLLLVVVFSCASAQIGSRRTTFNPAVHGFKFANSFSVEVVNDIRMSGFCGGMTFAALDYFKAGKLVPKQSYRPAAGTPLYDYIWGRQRTSVIDHIDKWTELFVNPFGSRTAEFFNWGLQGYGGGRLEELKREIDKGNPVPISLFKNGNGGAGPHHQVLAIGYKGGRYKGDLKDFKEDLEILVYDCNYPGETKVLKPDTKNFIYYYQNSHDDPSCQWQTYFVSGRYGYHKPTVFDAVKENPLASSKVTEILLEIGTGGDDLRGGNDNVSVTVRFRNGVPSQVFTNINKSARWIGNYTETVSLKLATPVNKEDIASILFSTSFGGGIGGDNWNMEKVRVMVNGGEVLKEKSGTPLNRFTGERKLYTLTIP